jgi:hypothetical protein
MELAAVDELLTTTRSNRRGAARNAVSFSGVWRSPSRPRREGTPRGVARTGHVGSGLVSWRTAVLAMAALGLIGCGGVSIAPDRIASMKSVSVAPAVKVPTEALYHGPEQAWGGAVGGVVGALIAQGAVKAPAQIKTYLANENIDVGAIVRTQFLKALHADSRFADKLRDSGDDRFELEVYLYGLVSNGPFSAQYRPWLGVQARLVDSSGKILWQDRDHVFLNEAVPLAPYLAYFERPETFRVGFAAAAETIIAMLLKRM